MTSVPTTSRTSSSQDYVHHRSKTILLIVHEVEDVAPVAALCALVGDLYRHRTYFSQQPMPVLRVAVTASLRHHFVCQDKNGNDQLVTWRAHESSDTSARWVTHVGAPDSLWPLDTITSTSRESTLLEDAFWGHSSHSNPLSHDDGGLADMILVGRSSCLSLPLWKSIAMLVEKLPQTNCPMDAPPLVIASLGNLRGLDWLSRMAFATVDNPSSNAHDNLRTTHPTNSQQQHLKALPKRRPLVLVGFASPLWYCRRIPDTRSANPRNVRTKYSFENSLVLMVGRRDSTSTAHQDVHFLSSTTLSPQEENNVLQLLRQTLFTPDSELAIAPSPTSFSVTPTRTAKTASILYIRSFLWSMLQDATVISFPCIMAAQYTESETNNDSMSLKPQPTLGSLVLMVLEEVLSALHRLHVHTKSHRDNNSNNNGGSEQTIEDGDDLFCQRVLHPLQKSLLAKLLGTGGPLMEDLTLNRMADVMPRLWENHYHKKNSLNASTESLWRQRWILEPLLTRSALAEWYHMTQKSPYSSNTATATSELQQQLCKDNVEYGLGLVLQLGYLLQMEQRQLTNLRWVVERVEKTFDARETPNVATKDNGSSAVPLDGWGIRTIHDLEEFLVRYPPFGKHSSIVNQPVSRL